MIVYWAWGLLALPLLPVALVALRRLFCWRRLMRAEAALDAADYEGAARLALPLTRTRLGARASMPAAAALLRLRRPDEAVAVLDAPPQWPASLRAPRYFMLAYANALQGRSDEAARHLSMSLAHDPELAAEARRNSVLQVILLHGDVDREIT